MSRIENKIDWCLKKGEKEGAMHRGLKKTPANNALMELHLSKAQRDLDVMEYLISGKFIDWAIIGSFYVRYHCLLAILAKFGYESRNQECTFAVVEQLIIKGKLNLSLEDFQKIHFYDENNMMKKDNDIVGLRERYQYGTQANVMDIEVNVLRKETKEFIEKTRLALQNL